MRDAMHRKRAEGRVADDHLIDVLGGGISVESRLRIHPEQVGDRSKAVHDGFDRRLGFPHAAVDALLWILIAHRLRHHDGKRGAEWLFSYTMLLGEEEAQQHPLQLLHIIAVRRQPQKARVGFSYLGHAWILAQKAMCLQIPAA